MKYGIKVINTSQISEKEIKDFIFVQQEVFSKTHMEYEDFKLKFLDNIYGDSIIVIAYDGETPAGARAFWRNDINGIIAYQPSDTAVREMYRKQGLFVEMTLPVINSIDASVIIYNYPNNKSYPQYKKLGWKDYCIQYTRLFSVLAYEKEEPTPISLDYFNWWTKNRLNGEYGFVKIFGNYYLVRRLSKYGRYLVFGKMEKECARCVPRVFPLLLVFHSEKCPFYNRKRKVGCKIVYKSHLRPEYIPSWKTDVY
ncbi:MAG: GNAT family N-acetyltransferase [Saccharofermentans sp.]|nr:GNAT family N-acetyltransferase [Saccharofermentans sp.]